MLRVRYHPSMSSRRKTQPHKRPHDTGSRPAPWVVAAVALALFAGLVATAALRGPGPNLSYQTPQLYTP